MDLLIEAFIFLAAGVIAVPIASRFGLGSVLGYLIAGVLIGPYALKLINDAEYVMHFAEFGVVMMLFLIGLELQPQVLWRMRNPILGLGGLQVAITTFAFAGITMAFDLPWQTALAIGSILSLSSTALALQVLEEKNLMKTEAGKSSFAVLLFQDIAVIPFIAILPLLAVSTPNSSITEEHASYNLIANLATWQQAIIVLGVIITIVLAGRYLTRPLFRFIAESGLREIFTAAALLLVVGIELVMRLVGLSPALGAFIAGVVLANNEYRHELEANIVPFKALLLGLFFMTIGAGIDFSLIASMPFIICGLVVGLIIVKFIILWVLARFFGLIGGDRYWFTFALAQGGEFGFVLLSLSLETQVIPAEIVSTLTAAIAVSMVLTPILIVLNEKYIQPLFDQAKDDEPEEMEEQHNPVIIAGFGRFGQIVGRLLLANQYSVTLLDHSASHIERVREFGFTLFYGDASREDLLHTAGAGKARLLIIAIDDREKTNKIAETAKRHYPHLKVLARAFDVLHYHELHAIGVDYIKRELFQGSLNVGKHALIELGIPTYTAERKAKLFAQHDEKTMNMLVEHREDRIRFISETRLAEEEMMKILRSEQEEWDKSDNNADQQGDTQTESDPVNKVTQ